AIGDREAGRLDDMHLNTETGTKPENRPGILRDVRLVKGDPDSGTGDLHASDQAGLSKRFMRPIFAGRARNQAPIEPRRLRAYVAFTARAGAKSVPSLVSRAFPGLRYHGKGANRTPPTRCPAFSGLPQPGPPRRPKDFAPGSSRGRKNKPAGGEDLRRDDRVFG